LLIDLLIDNYFTSSQLISNLSYSDCDSSCLSQPTPTTRPAAGMYVKKRKIDVPEFFITLLYLLAFSAG